MNQVAGPPFAPHLLHHSLHGVPSPAAYQQSQAYYHPPSAHLSPPAEQQLYYQSQSQAPNRSAGYSLSLPQNGSEMASTAGAGNMMQQQYAAQTYTSAPYSQSIPAQAPAALQNQRTSQTASPQHLSAGNRATPPQHHTPPTKYPMAAPPLPLTPSIQQQQQQAQPQPHSTTRSPNAPSSPSTTSHNLEQQRIALLLDINAQLLQEVSQLQAQGQGGFTAQQAAQLKAAGQPDAPLGSDNYIQCIRRLQANLGYLMPRAQQVDPQKRIPGPALISPPPHMAERLQGQYEELRALFPGWLGLERRMMAAGSPRQNLNNSNSNNNVNS